MRLQCALVCVGIGLLLGACASHGPRTRRASPPPQPPATSGVRSEHAPRDNTARSQSERYRQNDDNGPAAPLIDVSKIPEPVPKVEPRSRYGNKPTYSVLGQSYHVLDDARGYDEKGLASWYGNKFHGYMTSSFEAYDMYAFSAAHKTLPLPSYARVTNLDNGKSVIVRINDRGPFHENRIIDLSYAAAVKIGIWPKGTGVVEVRAIDPSQPDVERPSTRTVATSPAHAPPPSLVAATRIAPGKSPAAVARGDTSSFATVGTRGAARIYLQLGAFDDRANAERAGANATRAGLEHVGIESVAVAGRTVHRVRVGPVADAAAADALSERIEKLGFGAPRVAIER